MAAPVSVFEGFTLYVAPDYEWKATDDGPIDYSPPHFIPEQPFTAADAGPLGLVLQPHQGEHARITYRDGESWYLEFSELPIDDLPRLAAFARKRGLLGRVRVQRQHGTTHVEGEPWEYWATEILRMRHAIALRKQLSVDPQHDHSTRWDHEPGYQAVLRAREASADAWHHALGTQPRSRLSKIVEPQLAGIHPRLKTADDGTIALSFEPDSLLSAMWLQFALTAHAGAEIRQCPRCLRQFEVGWKATIGAHRRSHSIYCENSNCKLIQSRKRHRETLRLGRETNRTTRSIAKEVGSTEQQVLTWLRKAGIAPKAPKQRTHEPKTRTGRRHNRQAR